MKGRATEIEGVRRTPKTRTVAHFMKATAAAELLRAQHGEAEARKIALTEQRRARRARSKRLFAFWGEVAARIENGNCNNAVDTRPADREGPASRL
jgi:ADP-ribose pyrophosphatase YjhB (NUDIX family)